MLNLAWKTTKWKSMRKTLKNRIQMKSNDELKNVAINNCSNQEKKEPNTRNKRDAFCDARHFTYLSIIIIEILSTLVSIYFGHFSNWNFTCSSISIGFYFVTILLSVYIVPFGLVCIAWMCFGMACPYAKLIYSYSIAKPLNLHTQRTVIESV